VKTFICQGPYRKKGEGERPFIGLGTTVYREKVSVGKISDRNEAIVSHQTAGSGEERRSKAKKK